MREFFVATVDFFTHELHLSIRPNTDWKRALAAHLRQHRVNNSASNDDAIIVATKEQIEDLPDDLEEAKHEAFDQDWMFDFIER